MKTLLSFLFLQLLSFQEQHQQLLKNNSVKATFVVHSFPFNSIVVRPRALRRRHLMHRNDVSYNKIRGGFLDAINMNNDGGLSSSSNANDNFSSSDEGSDYDTGSHFDSSDCDEDVDNAAYNIDVVNDQEGNNAAKNAKKMSNFSMNDADRTQLSKSYSLSSILWLSITMDILFNSKKRCLLMPEVVRIGGKVAYSNICTTILLASGFMLAAGLSFVLSRSLNMDDEDNRSSNKLRSTSTTAKSMYNFITNQERSRQKMHLLLFSFGIVNLGANINPTSAPFLGMSGFIINTHNALIGLNGWMKDTIVEGRTVKQEIMNTCKSIVHSLLPQRNTVSVDSASMTMWQKLTSSMLSLAIIVSIINIIAITNASLLPYYAMGKMKVAPIEHLQLIGLQWASLARSILCGGLCSMLKDEVDNGRFSMKNGNIMNGLLGVGALAVSVGSGLSLVSLACKLVN